ncbi:MAG: adenosine deaminase family protein [Verrucomicrobia bacterium]|nr:adenosine deaminase family protein [Verrucomicrobiota bacterium]
MSPPDLAAFVQRLPKTETHLHLEGSLPLELARRMDPEYFAKPPVYWRPDFRFTDFAQFQEQFDRYFFKWFVSPENYFESCKRVMEDVVAQNGKYLEASFHLGTAERIGDVPFREIARAIHAAKPPGLELRLFLGMFRDHYAGPLAKVVDEAIAWDEIAGVDLHGFERPEFQPWSADIWEKVRALGKVIKAHAGEFAPPDDVRRAVEYLGVRRVQHGLSALADPAVMQLLRDRDVTLDMTPISNVKLLAVPSMREHPIKRFLDAGVRCTISTDDPMLFGNRLNDEYVALATEAGLDRATLVRIARNGFEVADLPAWVKADYFAELDALDAS